MSCICAFFFVSLPEIFRLRTYAGMRVSKENYTLCVKIDADT